MKKALRGIGYLVVLLIVVVVAFLGFIEMRGVPKYSIEKVDFPQVEVTPERVAMGEKIAAVQCAVCHRGSDGKLSGRLLQEMPHEFGEVHSRNITQSKAQGIGSWTDEQIAYLLRTGCKPDGQYIPIYMPKFAHMSDEDLKSVIAFLHSSDAVVQPSELPDTASKPSLLIKILCLVEPKFKKIPYPQAAISIPDTNNGVEYGKYLVTGRYDCYPCHSKDFTKCDMQHPELSLGYMGGGNTLMSLDGKVRYTANITMCPKTGIGTWTLEDLDRALRTHKNKDGHTIREPMLVYNGLTDLELKSIWQYIQTVPVIENKVDRKWNEE